MSSVFLHVGFNGYVDGNSLIAVLSPDSAPVRRMIKEAERSNKVINMTFGRKTKAVLVHNNSHVTLVALQPETIVNRWAKMQAGENEG